MQIAIVDDSAEDREELSACLENYMKKHQLDYTLAEFEGIHSIHYCSMRTIFKRSETLFLYTLNKIFNEFPAIPYLVVIRLHVFDQVLEDLLEKSRIN